MKKSPEVKVRRGASFRFLKAPKGREVSRFDEPTGAWHNPGRWHAVLAGTYILRDDMVVYLPEAPSVSVLLDLAIPHLKKKGDWVATLLDIRHDICFVSEGLNPDSPISQASVGGIGEMDIRSGLDTPLDLIPLLLATREEASAATRAVWQHRLSHGC